jgi:hypothetical protein
MSNPQDGKKVRGADDRWGLLEHRLQNIAQAAGDRGRMRFEILNLCEMYAEAYDGGRRELLLWLYYSYVDDVGEEATRRAFAALTSKRYNRERRERRLIFEYETTKEFVEISEAEFIRRVIEKNNSLPREQRLGSRSKIPGAVASNVNKILKKYGKKRGKPKNK